MSLQLHNYFRSSTSIRVRIALNFKGLAYDYKAYPLLEEAHKHPDFLAINPQGLVPSLETPDGVLSQSLAIIEYLDESYPTPPLLPATAWARARVRSLSQIVAMEIHPVNNLRVLQYLRAEFDADDAALESWFQHWANEGFSALETRLATETDTGRFCHQDTVSLADVCLVSQAINNRRFNLVLDSYPTIERIVNECLSLPAFQQAMPEQQSDAV